MDSQGKGTRPSIFKMLTAGPVAKRRKRMDISVLAARYEQGLDLWSGEPLPESEQRPQNVEELS